MSIEWMVLVLNVRPNEPAGGRGFLRVGELPRGSRLLLQFADEDLEAIEVVTGLQTCTLIQGSDLNQVLLTHKQQKAGLEK